METKNLYDLIVIGGGPAGLTSAIYMARAKYKTLILEKNDIGGQISLTEEVVNYPGILNTTGKKMVSIMYEQALNFGAEYKVDEVIDMKLDQDIKEIITKNGKYQALTVIISTGANPRKLGFDGEEKYKGRGVAYCATCDGEFFTDKNIYVIGSGFAAAEEAMFLTRYGKKVTIIARESELICANSIIEKVKSHNPKIDIVYNAEPVSLEGENFPQKLICKSNIDDRIYTFEDNGNLIGTFIFSGYIPNTNLVKNIVELDERGYILTNDSMQTNLEGVFAAGDLRPKDLRQVVTATSDGAIAAYNAEKVALKLHEKYNIGDLFTFVKKENKIEKVEDKSVNTSTNEFITEEMVPQLQTIFSKINKEFTLIGNINSNDLSKEMKIFLNEMKEVSKFVNIKLVNISDNDVPFLEIEYENKKLNYKFYGLPGGHEFTSFILTIYNLLGPKKEIEPEVENKIKKLGKEYKLDVAITLTCTKCPKLILSIASLMSYTDKISLNIHDINHSFEIKDKYNIMSVPCMVVNDSTHDFGEKSMDQVLDMLLSN